ncbi:MaoC family dehydratase [Sandaracinobacter sp. RS1-74]|uniref:MaoC family dehydratase n=1 Tax=Sandaracinobacteroides sayramensis TaxID=2913411 RepID=UPI001EDC3300|nr:MaoC family dehydratase [Sandaracinobacteroides sayramensis]MCG2841337.1 MaoC family dehydratase [Sandaracinobacteroides sayramensis]
MSRTLPIAEYLELKGKDLGTSAWIEVSQERIDRFADVTEDHQFIHIDPERAKATPFGSTIAHGFLSLSLLSAMAYDAMPGIEGAKMGVNYGFNSIRFLAPVKSGRRVRGHFRLLDVVERSPGVFQSTVEVKVAIEGEDKPALSAEWLSLAYL